MKQIIARRYGFGAARIALNPAQLRRRPTPSLRDGWRATRREEGQAISRALRGALLRGSVPTLAALLLSLLLASLLREREDTSAVEIVAFEEPVVVAEEPEVPEEIIPEPEPVVEPEPEVAPAPPEPEIVAVKPPPPPEPPRRVPAPEPPPRVPPKPKPAPRIEPVAPPVVARAPAPPEPPRAPRNQPVPKARTAPPVAFAAAALPNEPEPSDASAPRRATPFPAARPSDTRPRLDLAAPAPIAENDMPAAPTRSARVSATPPAPSRSAPALDFAAAAPPAAPSEPRRESNARRPAAVAPPRRRERGNPAALAMPGAPPRDPLPPASPAAPARSQRPVAPTTTTSARQSEPGLRGVPLASLDACRTDREEDALKQRVVAAAEDRGVCESAAGRFHFVETKNVNAFLMRIERAPGRRTGDRCVELLHALDCLARSARKGG